MANQDCERCEGKGFYILPNYQHEILERIECEPCMFEEHEKWHLTEEISKMLSNASVQKLSMIVAKLLVEKYQRYEKEDNFARLHTIIQSKNITEALVLADMYSEG